MVESGCGSVLAVGRKTSARGGRPLSARTAASSRQVFLLFRRVTCDMFSPLFKRVGGESIIIFLVVKEEKNPSRFPGSMRASGHVTCNTLSTPPATRALPANSRSPHHHCIKRSGETLPQTLSALHLPQMPTSTIRKKKPSGRRGSGTTGLASEAEKIMSGVERQLIKLLDSDSDEDAAELARVWPNAPPSCVVVVPGVKGHFKYIMNIKDRLAGEGFVLGLPYPHRPKVAGQLSLQQEAAMRRRQAKEDTALTPEQKERIEFNRRRALEIRHAASAQSGGRAEDFC